MSRPRRRATLASCHRIAPTQCTSSSQAEAWRRSRPRSRWRALAEERVRVELLAPEPHFWYRPLAVAEPFELGEVRRFELSKLAADAGATFTPGELVG